MSTPARPGVPYTMPAPDRIARSGSRSVYRGNVTPEIAVASYNVSGGDDGAIGTHGLGVYIPDNAVITRVIYDVVTTFTDGADDSATISLGLATQAPAGFRAATAISAGGDIYDAGTHETLIGNFALDGNALSAVAMAAARAATYVKTTAERELVAVVADDALTAGNMNIYVEYFISD